MQKPASSGAHLVTFDLSVHQANQPPCPFHDMRVMCREQEGGSVGFVELSHHIDEIVRRVRFPDWQTTSAGEREVKKALRKTLFKYKLHQDKELFIKAYGYIKQYY